MSRVDGDWRTLAHAEQLLQLGRYAEAERRFRHALVAEPQSVPALLGLGRALGGQDRHDEAEHVVRGAIALSPDEPAGHHLLTDLLVDMGAGRAALAAAEEAVRLAPHAFTSHYQHARALLSLRRPRAKQAMRSARRALEIAPHDPDAHNLVGMCHLTRGRRRQARASFLQALELAPQHTLAQNNLAVADMGSGRWGDAAVTLGRAAANDPRERLLHRNLDVLLVVLVRRVVAIAFLGTMFSAVQVSGSPVARAITAGVAVVLVLVAVTGFRGRFPPGLLRPSRMWHDLRWGGLVLTVMLALSVTALLFVGFAPASALTAVQRSVGDSTLGFLLLVSAVTWIATRRLSDR